MNVKKKIIITGQKVHDIGYRPFLLGMAESLEIERFFADNIFINKKQTVYAIVESSEEKVEAFIEMASSKFPDKSDVERVDTEDYSGNVMRMESYYRYLTAMQLSKIATYGGKMLEKQDSMLEKQDSMLEKQDTTTDILKSIKADTSKISKIEENTSLIPAMREDIASIRYDTREIAAKLWDKYEEMSKEITEMKITLSRIEAKVFG